MKEFETGQSAAPHFEGFFGSVRCARDLEVPELRTVVEHEVGERSARVDSDAHFVGIVAGGL